jgi:hypothetical protein
MIQTQQELWVLVDADNYNGDYPNEGFVKLGSVQGALYETTKDVHEAYQFGGEEYAKAAADSINTSMGDNASRYVKAERISYKLAPGFEP